MNALAHLPLTGTFLGVLAALATRFLLSVAHDSVRTARVRAVQRRQRTQVRRGF